MHYPKWKYHPAKDAVVVGSKDAEEALGDGWFESPAHFGVETCPAKSGPDPVIAANRAKPLESDSEQNHQKIEETDQPKKTKKVKA